MYYCKVKDKLVRHEMGADEGEDPETARYKALQKQNEICVGHLGNLGFKSTLLEAKLVEKEESVRAQLTVPYSEERILDIKSASSHGARFKATGGFTISGDGADDGNENDSGFFSISAACCC